MVDVVRAGEGSDAIGEVGCRVVVQDRVEEIVGTAESREDPALGEGEDQRGDRSLGGDELDVKVRDASMRQGTDDEVDVPTTPSGPSRTDVTPVGLSSGIALGTSVLETMRCALRFCPPGTGLPAPGKPSLNSDAGFLPPVSDHDRSGSKGEASEFPDSVPAGPKFFPRSSTGTGCVGFAVPVGARFFPPAALSPPTRNPSAKTRAIVPTLKAMLFVFISQTPFPGEPTDMRSSGSA